jgi:hypothetical protein
MVARFANPASALTCEAVEVLESSVVTPQIHALGGGGGGGDGGGGAAVTVIEKAASEALCTPSLTEMTMLG